MSGCATTLPARTWGGSLHVTEDGSGQGTYRLGDVLNRLIHGDALAIMDRLEPEIADCVFFDPPYFLQLSGNSLKRWGANSSVQGVSDDWDKFGSFAAYDEFIASALRGIRRLMKPTATLWTIGTYHSIFRVGRAMQDLGFWVLNDVTWIKTNPMPNWLGVRFTNATETLIWASRSREARGYTFNRLAAKEYGIGKVGAGVWVLPTCGGSERVKGPDGKKAHPTQKPAELLRRVIATSTQPGDLILDPMAGVGTTGFVAREMDRDFVMIEREAGYVRSMIGRFDGPADRVARRCPDAAKVAGYLGLEDAAPADQAPPGSEGR